MVTDITIINKLGLHARAAAKMATLAARFGSKIEAGIGDRMVDAKSVMSLMLLAASKGTQLKLRIDGEDAEEAMAALTTLINNRFDEAE